MTYAILNSTMPTIPQTSRSRPAMGARRLNNENVASGPSQPITYVKDVLSAVQSRPRQTAPGAIQATRKRVLGEKPIVLVSSSSNTNNSNNNIHPSASDKEVNITLPPFLLLLVRHVNSTPPFFTNYYYFISCFLACWLSELMFFHVQKLTSKLYLENKNAILLSRMVEVVAVRLRDLRPRNSHSRRMVSQWSP